MDICLVAHNAFGAITGGFSGHVGGVERQTSLMSKWLADRGHKVSILTWDERQTDRRIPDGLQVIKMCSRDDGIAGVRFFYPRWTSLNHAMRQANAEVYYQNCAEYVTGQVALWCKMHGKHFVYSVASDLDCDPKLPGLHTLRERVLYRYGLRNAEHIVVQTRKQQTMLRDGFGLNSASLPMPCPGPPDKDYVSPMPSQSGKGIVLWVGRISRVKRLELLLEVSELLPDVVFEIAGSPDDEPGYVNGLISRAKQLPNVIFQGRVERERMPELYQKASLLCCTSRYEGFPNTFLEAWSYGLPIVSSIDPDEVMSIHHMGITADSASGFAESIKLLVNSPGRWKVMSTNARRFYLENHAVDKAMRNFEDLFKDIVNGKRNGRSPA